GLEPRALDHAILDLPAAAARRLAQLEDRPALERLAVEDRDPGAVLRQGEPRHGQAENEPQRAANEAVHWGRILRANGSESKRPAPERRIIRHIPATGQRFVRARQSASALLDGR